MSKNTNKKAKLCCVILTLIMFVVFLIAGIWQGNIYSNLKHNCTSEIWGTVVHKGYGRILGISDAESRYLTDKRWIQIEVDADEAFEIKNIYANLGSEKVDDEVTVYYNPQNPDEYYIGGRIDYYRKAEIFAYSASGLMALLSVFLIIITFKPQKSRKKTC
jgi:hypothetical protein